MVADNEGGTLSIDGRSQRITATADNPATDTSAGFEASDPQLRLMWSLPPAGDGIPPSNATPDRLEPHDGGARFDAVGLFVRLGRMLYADPRQPGDAAHVVAHIDSVMRSLAIIREEAVAEQRRRTDAAMESSAALLREGGDGGGGR